MLGRHRVLAAKGAKGKMDRDDPSYKARRALRRTPIDIRAAIAVGAALPSDLRDFPIAAGVGRHVRVWLLVGEEDPFRAANEAFDVAPSELHIACHLTLVPDLRHDLPEDFSPWLQEAIRFALD